MLDKLKHRWGINSNFQVLKIFIVFGITGSTAAWISDPICDFFGISTENLNTVFYWVVRIVLITIVYKFILIFVAFLFGEFNFSGILLKSFYQDLELDFNQSLLLYFFSNFSTFGVITKLQ